MNSEKKTDIERGDSSTTTKKNMNDNTLSFLEKKNQKNTDDNTLSFLEKKNQKNTDDNTLSFLEKKNQKNTDDNTLSFLEKKNQKNTDDNTWRSCCLVVNPHAVAYFSQIFISIAVLIISTYMIILADGSCDRASPWINLISFMVGKILSSVISSV